MHQTPSHASIPTYRIVVSRGEVVSVEVRGQSVVEAKQRALVALQPRHRRLHLRPAVERRGRLPRGSVEQRQRVQRGQRGAAVVPAGGELVAEEGEREVGYLGDLRSNSTTKRTSAASAASAEAPRNRGASGASESSAASK